MSPLALSLLVVAAFVAGTVDAIAGGGGLITVPALLNTRLPTGWMLGTNKGQSTWGAAAALFTFWRAGKVDRRAALFTFPLGMLGAVIGATTVLAIPERVLRVVVVALLVAAASLLLVRKPEAAVDAPPPRKWVAPLLALVIGTYDGFFGPGTGTFLIVGLVALCGRSLVHASADAKVINLASNLGSLAVFASRGVVMWSVALPMAAGQLCGGLVGARLAMRGGAKVVRAMVLVVSGGLVAKLVWQLISA